MARLVAHRAVVALLGALAFVIPALSGCGNVQPPGPAVAAAPDPMPAPKTDLHFGPAGSFPAEVGKLHGIAIDANDRIYLVGSAGVRVLGADRKQLAAWKVPDNACAIAVGSDGTVYVGLTASVLKFDPAGKPLGRFGKEGPDTGQLRRITSIAVTAENIYVADARNLCINRYALDGDFINDIGKRDRERNVIGLVAPSPYLDVVVDKDARVLVGNTGRLRVETYGPDGKLLRMWGQPGTQPDRFCGCCNPTNIALTPEGNIVTAEKGIPRVKVYDPAGKMLAYIGPENFPQDSAGMDLAVDSKGSVYVAEPVKGLVMVFAPLKPKE